jgi:hypothetical protein
MSSYKETQEAKPMRLSKASKIALLVATFLPALYMVLFFASFALTSASAAGPKLIFDNFAVFMAVHLAMMLLMIALITFYIVFLFKTDRVRNDMKAVWAVAIFMGSIVAMPVFWFLYIWPGEGSSDPAPAG